MAHLIPSFVLSTIFFVLTFFGEMFVLCKVGPSNLDKLAIILMVNFLLVMLIRFASMILHEILD